MEMYKVPIIKPTKRLGEIRLQPNASFCVNEMLDVKLFIDKYLGSLVSEASVVESSLVRLIGGILNVEGEERITFVRAWLLEASFLTFEAKRSIAVAWNDQYNVISGVEKNDFQKDLSKTIERRNLLVHGEPTFSSDQKLVIKYFRGGPCEVEFNEEFINGTSEIFVSTNEKIMKLVKQVESAN